MVEAGKKIDVEATKAFIDKHWDDWFVKGLCEFIEIPNLSPMVDEEYLKNGHVEKAMALVDDYINKLDIKGISR